MAKPALEIRRGLIKVRVWQRRVEEQRSAIFADRRAIVSQRRSVEGIHSVGARRYSTGSVAS